MTFKSSRGHEIKISQGDGCSMVAWSDPKTGSWEAKTDNEAGYIVLPLPVSDNLPIVEHGDTIKIGERIELRYCGAPFIYGVNVLDK